MKKFFVALAFAGGLAACNPTDQQKANDPIFKTETDKLDTIKSDINRISDSATQVLDRISDKAAVRFDKFADSARKRVRSVGDTLKSKAKSKVTDIKNSTIDSLASGMKRKADQILNKP